MEISILFFIDINNFITWRESPEGRWTKDPDNFHLPRHRQQYGANLQELGNQRWCCLVLLSKIAIVRLSRSCHSINKIIKIKIAQDCFLIEVIFQHSAVFFKVRRRASSHGCISVYSSESTDFWGWKIRNSPSLIFPKRQFWGYFQFLPYG